MGEGLVPGLNFSIIIVIVVVVVYIHSVSSRGQGGLLVCDPSGVCQSHYRRKRGCVHPS